jgi:hypothetical protein
MSARSDQFHLPGSVAVLSFLTIDTHPFVEVMEVREALAVFCMGRWDHAQFRQVKV